jgi:hypothetical protein
MNRRVLWVVLSMAVVAAACGDSDDATTTAVAAPSTEGPATSAPPSATTLAPPTEESESHPLVIASVDFDAGVIEIRNDGTEPYDPSGHWLCNRPTYLPFPEGVIDPGASITIETAGLNVQPSGGEIGLYTERDFGSADAMIRYVQWGGAGGGRASVAGDAGLWPDGDFVDNGDASFSSSGANPVSSADWTVN